MGNQDSATHKSRSSILAISQFETLIRFYHKKSRTGSLLSLKFSSRRYRQQNRLEKYLVTARLNLLSDWLFSCLHEDIFYSASLCFSIAHFFGCSHHYNVSYLEFAFMFSILFMEWLTPLVILQLNIPRRQWQTIQ